MPVETISNSKINFHSIFTTELANQSISSIAKTRATKMAYEYARSGVPTSPYQNLSGNNYPNFSKINWLRGLNKCNQFVGDVLTMSGYKMPTFRMSDGTEHYMHAEALPKQTQYFDIINNASSIKEGDLIVFDQKKRSGENGAHVEIITTIDINKGILELTGARRLGAKTREASQLLQGFKLSNNYSSFTSGKDTCDIYILRAKRLTTNLSSN